MKTDNKSQPVVWVKELNLNDEQKDLMSMLINIFGESMHPCADRDTIGGFSVSYLKEILSNEKLVEGRAKQEADILAILDSVEEKLKLY